MRSHDHPRKTPEREVRVRPLDLDSDDEVELVATRMRGTLAEVLGAERGRAMYSMDWLRDRVRFHLDPSRSTAAVFLAEESAGDIAGHTIVRVETDDAGARIGLFSTTFVAPHARRRGIAGRLLERGERWMREQELTEATTWTAQTNDKLIRLFERRDYQIVEARSEMVRLARTLTS